MKKILSPLAVLAVLASCATAPSAPTAAVAQPTAVAPAPAPTQPKEMKVEEALPVSIKSFYANGDPSGTVTMKYDARGKLTLQESFNGNGVLVETRVGKAKGELWRISVTNSQTGDIASYEDRTYGPGGELQVQTFLSAKEIVQASNEYSYDKQGRKVLWLAKTGGGALQAKTSYAYDANGNNISTQLFDGAGNLTNVFENTYDSQNQIISRKGFDAGKNLVESTTFTWVSGRKMKEETTKPLLRTLEYSYGEKSAPTGVISSVRGKVVEKQLIDYQWFTKTVTVNP